LLHQLRDYASGRHLQVDDTPYGGGPGMLMRPEPLVAAIEHVAAAERPRRILLSPRGVPFSDERARALACEGALLLICPRYAGVGRRRCARRSRAAPICSRARRSATRTAPSSAGSGGAMADLYLALLHHPVYDKNGAVVTTAVTNMDVHDLGRLARTYDVRAFYVATPVPTLRRLVERIMRHWDTGPGAAYNHTRKEALALARLSTAL